jgi:hypothetical protein
MELSLYPNKLKTCSSSYFFPKRNSEVVEKALKEN